MNKKYLIGPDVKLLASPLLVILISIAIGFYLVNFSKNNLVLKFNDLKMENEKTSILKQKIETLKIFNSEVSGDKSNLVYQILPESSTASVFLSQLRKKIIGKNLEFGIIAIHKPTTSEQNIQKSDVDVEFESDSFDAIVQILKETENSAPLSTLVEANISNMSDNKIKVESKYNIYWSSLPVVIPDLNDPVKELSPEDKLILNKIGSFELPEFSELIPEEVFGRTSPFN